MTQGIKILQIRFSTEMFQLAPNVGHKINMFQATQRPSPLADIRYLQTHGIQTSPQMKSWTHHSSNVVYYVITTK